MAKKKKRGRVYDDKPIEEKSVLHREYLNLIRFYVFESFLVSPLELKFDFRSLLWLSSQGREGLPGKKLHAPAAGRGREPQGHGAAAQVLHSQAADSHVGGTHEGHLGHQVVPHVRPPSTLLFHGLQDQGTFSWLGKFLFVRKDTCSVSLQLRR